MAEPGDIAATGRAAFDVKLSTLDAGDTVTAFCSECAWARTDPAAWAFAVTHASRLAHRVTVVQAHTSWIVPALPATTEPA